MATAKFLTYDEFEKKYLGKAVDYDGVAGVQCVDLIDQYLKDTFGITGVWVQGARDFYNKFESYPALVANFDRIPNTRELVCQKGDIAVRGTGKWGHIVICDGAGDKDWFSSIEQNTLAKHEPTQRVTHRFSEGGWLGVLRAKDQTKVLGKAKTTTKKATFKEYVIRVKAPNGLNVRTAPGISAKNKIVMVLHNNEVYTIVAEQTVNGEKWGQLKSKAGWICLKYTAKY